MLRRRAAPSRELFEFFLVDLVHAHVTMVYPARLLQPFVNLMCLSAESRTLDDDAAIFHAEIEHAQMPDVTPELCTNTIQKDVIGNIIRAIADR